MSIFDFFYKTSIENFDEIKQSVLDNIQDGRSIDTSCDTITRTDWNTGAERPYLKYLEQHMSNHNRSFCQELGYSRVHISDAWYQQYNNKDTHGYHNHPLCSFSNIIYVELPYKESSTIFKIKDEVFTVEVKEGDILSFPGIIIHGSPQIHEGRKTVVVYNTDAFV